MNLPRDYDDWRLQGPDDGPDMTECDACDGTGHTLADEHTTERCPDCGGSGEVPVTREEPDADYLRDLRMDR